METLRDDPHHLLRFVGAQQDVYEQVREELRGGRKRSHWMWFIFPQVDGLGMSSMARRYAIASLSEARAYLAHPLLGERLRECTRLVNAVQGRPLDEIFWSPDDLKFRSSMTLFAHASNNESLFLAALQKYCGGEPDPLTLERLSTMRQA